MDVPTPKNLTVEILKQIRGELQQTNSRLDTLREDLGGRIDAVREELGGRIDLLTHRMVESEVRTATAITDVGLSVREVSALLHQRRDLLPRVERCEKDIAELKRVRTAK